MSVDSSLTVLQGSVLIISEQYQCPKTKIKNYPSEVLGKPFRYRLPVLPPRKRTKTSSSTTKFKIPINQDTKFIKKNSFNFKIFVSFQTDFHTYSARYGNVTLTPLVFQWGLRFGSIQRNGAAPGVIHTGRFFVLIPLKWLEKLTGVKDKYI